MKKILMYVYNDIITDARVQRAASALSDSFELTLVSTKCGKIVHDSDYKNILVGGRFHGAMDLLDSIFSTFRLICKEHPDVVYCHDYYSAILAFLLIITRYSGKIIYDAHELIIPEKGHKNFRLSFFYWFEKKIVKKADLLICASEQRGEIMYDHYGLGKKPFVVPNISQLQMNDESNDVKNILASLGDFFESPGSTIVYAGVVTSSRKINKLLDAAIALSDKCKLLVIGDGDALQSLKDKSAKHSELKSAFTGAVPYNCLGSLLSRCDVGFLYYPSDTLNNKYCASNKIYEYASVGLPILSNENPTIEVELNNGHIGISSDNLEQGLRELLRSKDIYKQHCRDFSLKNSWVKRTQLFREAVKGIWED